MGDVFALASLALTGASLVFVGALVARRVHTTRLTERRARVREALRPAAFAILAGEPAPTPHVTGGSRDAALFAELLAEYARRLRGPARDRVAAFFETRHELAAELTALDSRRTQRRAAAAHRLGDMGSPSSVAPLLERLEHDRSREVRAASARSLGALGAADAVPALVRALALRRVPHAQAAQALLAIGPAAVPELVPLLASAEPEVRAWAAELIGLLGDASDGETLARHLHDTSAEVRARAARALGRLGSAEAAAGLREALTDRVPSVRSAAAFALGRLRDEEALAPLLDLARTDLFEPAREAAEAAARIDPAAVRALAASTASGHLREAAARAR